MEEEQVCLRLLVDKEKNRVLSAEAGKDFVDALFGFLTLPLGTIARIVGKDSNLKPVRVGSLSSLYQSVANLEEKHFWTDTCKEMLLQPRNSMESLQNPQLNIDDDSEPIKYFLCENRSGVCRQGDAVLVSTFKNTRCRCGRLMNREISLDKSLPSNEIHQGYVNETAAFTISDDLKIMPSDLQSSVALLKNLGIEDMDSVEEMTVNVNQKEVVDLLKCSLLSKTPLTDLFLRKKEIEEDFERDGIFPFDFKIGKAASSSAAAPAEDSRHMKVKLMLKKSKNKVLFAQAEEDFADFLLSFLTLPLGTVLYLLQGNSGSISLDNLFKSLAYLHAGKHLRSEEIKKILTRPQIASQFQLQNPILPIYEAPAANYSYSGEKLYDKGNERKGLQTSSGRDYRYIQYVYQPVTFLDPKSSSVDAASPGGFAKGPSMYMVTDDLVVTPISSISVASFLNKSKIPLYDLEERVISIGLEEGLSILKASLISSSALTMGLSPFIERERIWEERRGKDNIDCIFSLFREFILKRKINF